MINSSLAAQAFIACLASAANYISVTDPGRGRLPDETKDKPIDRVFESKQKYRVYSSILFGLRDMSTFATLTQAGCLTYFALNPEKVTFSTKYATSFFLVSIVGVSWRYWCYRTLDKFFTFRIQIQDGQKIIKHGPYRYLAHPSYLGQNLNALGIAGATYGPFSVWMNWLSTKMIGKVNLFGKNIIINNRLLAQLAASFVGVLYLRHYLWLVRIRIPDEEAMLRKQFGDEYDEYLSQRWKVVPFIY